LLDSLLQEIMCDDDEDVVLEGSQLHQHLLDSGFSQTDQLEKQTKFETLAVGQNGTLVDKENNENSLDSHENRRLTSYIWPDSSNKLLEVELAQLVLRSELLVTEDEEFINNFILTEDTMEQYKMELEGGKGSIMKDVLLFSGSLAAVAGAVFFFSERTRAAVTAAAVIPTAVAAASSMRIGSKVSESREAEEFKRMIKQMLSDMKQFKMVLRKSLNLIQGMEMMNQGFINFTSASNDQPTNSDAGKSDSSESKFTKTLCQRSSLISLRRAIYTHTVQMISVYRQAIEKLMLINPLAEHVDLKDHYLAFIDLEKFGIEKEVPDERLSVRQLKDTIQLNLLQQSEYLRRFSLAFCHRVQEDESINKTGILKHVKEIISKLRTVSDKMNNVLEYHQSLGLVPLQELDQKCQALKKQQSIDQVRKLMPLRNVYTSLFSTGLHLQNSLLKLRHMEGLFETLEKSKDKETVANFMPNEKQLLDWLQGFQDIQNELNVCITCLDGGVEEIEHVARPRSVNSTKSSASSEDLNVQKNNATVNHETDIKENDEIAHMDEVFEAFISHDFKIDGLGFEDDFVPKKMEGEKKQSRRVMTELKHVLNGRKIETDQREAKALSRQRGFEEGFYSTENGCENGWHPEFQTGTSKMIEQISGVGSSVQAETQSLCSVSISLSSKTLSESSEENLSDAEVDKSKRTFSRNLMTNSIQHQKRSPMRHRKVNNLRSMSTPDIKNLDQHESSSPYMSLEVLGNSDIEDDSDSNLSDTDTDVADDQSKSDSYSTSDSEQEPRKPSKLSRSTKSSRKLPSKNGLNYSSNSQQKSSENGFSKNHSIYVSKHKEAMMKNLQPPGFDRELAADAIAKSRQLRERNDSGNHKEEYFGSSDTD